MVSVVSPMFTRRLAATEQKRWLSLNNFDLDLEPWLLWIMFYVF